MFGVSFHASRSLSAECGAAGEDVVQEDVQHENATFFLHCSQPCGIFKWTYLRLLWTGDGGRPLDWLHQLYGITPHKSRYLREHGLGLLHVRVIATFGFSSSPVSPTSASVLHESHPPARATLPMRGRSRRGHCKTRHSLSERGPLLGAARFRGHLLSVAWSFPSSHSRHDRAAQLHLQYMAESGLDVRII